MLFTGAEGKVAYWRMSTVGSAEFTTALPVSAGWSARDIGAASDGSVRILMVSGTGQARVHKATDATVHIGTTYAPQSRFSAVAISANTGNKSAILLTNPNRRFGHWVLGATGVIEIGKTVGPF